jgi:hypothetical protein
VQVQVQDRQKGVARLGEGTNLTWLEGGAGGALAPCWTTSSATSQSARQIIDAKPAPQLFRFRASGLARLHFFFPIILFYYLFCNLHFTLSNLRCFSRFDDLMILPSLSLCLANMHWSSELD